MKPLAMYLVCNRYVMGGKAFKNILIGPGKLPGLSSKRAPGSRKSITLLYFQCVIEGSWFAFFLSVLVCLGMDLFQDLKSSGGGELLTLSGPNSDQHQISPRNINAYTTPEVMRIKEYDHPGWIFLIIILSCLVILITSPQYFYKKSMGTR